MRRIDSLARVNLLCFLRLTVRVLVVLLETPFPYWCANSRSHSLARPLYMIIFPGLISDVHSVVSTLRPKLQVISARKQCRKRNYILTFYGITNGSHESRQFHLTFGGHVPKRDTLFLKDQAVMNLRPISTTRLQLSARFGGALLEFWPRKPFRLVDDGKFYPVHQDGPFVARKAEIMVDVDIIAVENQLSCTSS